MIERKNIIEILGTRKNVYHSAVLTCYTFDPIFFESIYLPVIRSLGVTNVVVLMDAKMYDQLLADPDYQYHSVSTINYTLRRQENTHHGVFHPKMSLLFGEEEGSLIIGSGNITYSGMSNNDEVWNAFHIAGSDSTNYPLFRKAWDYIIQNTGNAQSLVLKQLGWITEHSLWMQKELSENIVELKSGELCSLLFNSTNSSILEDLYASVGNTSINKITVAAPFYDTEGNAIKELQDHFSPNVLNCILDINRQSAPFALLNSTNVNFFKHISPNPLHAKIIEIQSENETWVLSGSANVGNMALGMNRDIFNDEVCILLHSKEHKDYIKELGLHFSPLKHEELESISRRETKKQVPSPIKVSLFSCEEKDGKLLLRFNKKGIKATLVALDKKQHNIWNHELTTGNEVSISLEDNILTRLHIVVLKDSDTEISNRVLVVREINVESSNPDPKRRKLSSLLDDNDLINNLSHILGYIEFEDSDKKSKSFNLKSKKSQQEKDDIVVKNNRFNALKDSKLSINMHSGIRILSYLQQILFKTDDNVQTDDDLLGLNEENNDETTDSNTNNKSSIESISDDATQIRKDIACFLKKMKQFLLNKTDDTSIYGDVNKVIGKPRLMAKPGLNAASSLAVATTSVICMLNKYGYYIIKRGEIQEELMKCASLFFSIYSNKYPYENSYISLRTRELLKSASVGLLVALSFYNHRKNNVLLTQLVLNCLDSWKEKQELNEIMPLYEEQLNKMNPENLSNNTIERIREIANIYLKEEIPLEKMGIHDTIYSYGNGYGFIVLSDIKKVKDGWSYKYQYSWFEGNYSCIKRNSFKGYINI